MDPLLDRSPGVARLTAGDGTQRVPCRNVGNVRDSQAEQEISVEVLGNRDSLSLLAREEVQL